MRNVAKKFLKEIRHPKIFYRKAKNRLTRRILGVSLIHFPKQETIIRQLDEMVSSTVYDTVFIFPEPSCPWGYMFQRPQQLARSLANKGYAVIYVTNTSYPYEPDWSVRGLKEIEPNLFLFNDGKSGELLSNCKHARLIIWQYWPHQWNSVELLRNRSSCQVIHVYDCIDDLTTFDFYEDITLDYGEALTSADVVLATSHILLNELKTVRSDVILVPNGVNPKDFHIAMNPRMDSFIRDRLVLGYYGAIAEWFDFDLIGFIAYSRPAWEIVIVGQVYDSVEDEVELLSKIPNVTVRGRIPYDQIPDLLSSFDIAILPFILNEITLRTSPVKVYEYLAGGKPTVCTDLPEVRGIPHVRRANSHESFLREIELAAVSLEIDPEQQILRDVATHNSWGQRAQIVLDLISSKWGGSDL